MRTKDLVCVLALLLAGCGGQSSHDDPDPTPNDGGAAGRTSGGDAGSTPSAGNTGGVRAGAGGGGGSGAAAASSSAGGPGCELKSQSADSDSCEVRYACESTGLVTRCSDRGEGRWGCDCERGEARDSYVLQGVSGLSACETIAEICETVGEPAFSGPTECGSVAGSRSTENCQLQGECARPLEANPLVRLVTRSNYTVSECKNDGTGAFNCSCEGGQEYRVLGSDGTIACDLVEDECERDAASTGKTCTVGEELVDADHCEVEAPCTEFVSLPTGVTEVRREHRWVNCTPLAGGRASCACQWGSVDLQFAFDDEGTPSASCGRAIAACLEAPVEVDEGPIECALAGQMGEDDTCQVFLGCTQSGTLGDLQVETRATLEAVCHASEDGASWSCSCRSSTTGETADMTAERGPDSWESCSAAAHQCREVVDVFPSLLPLAPP